MYPIPGTLEAMYPIPSKPGTPYSRIHAPCTPGSKPVTLYPRNHALRPVIWHKSGMTRQCLKIKIKPLTFQHKNCVYCFHFQYSGWEMMTWYSIVKKSWWNSKWWKWWNLLNTVCLKLIIEKENTKVVLKFTSLVVIMKSQGYGRPWGGQLQRYSSRHQNSRGSWRFLLRH